MGHSWREVAASGFSPLVKPPNFKNFFFPALSGNHVCNCPAVTRVLFTSFKRGTVTRLLEHWRTTAGFAPARLQGSEVVLNTLGPLQSRRFPPHFKTKAWEVRGRPSGTSTDKGAAKVRQECLRGVLASAASGAGTEGSAGTAQPHTAALL